MFCVFPSIVVASLLFMDLQAGVGCRVNYCLFVIRHVDVVYTCSEFRNDGFVQC